MMLKRLGRHLVKLHLFGLEFPTGPVALETAERLWYHGPIWRHLWINTQEPINLSSAETEFGGLVKAGSRVIGTCNMAIE